MTMMESGPLETGALEYNYEALRCRDAIVDAMREAAPPHQDRLDLQTYRHLQVLTDQLARVEGEPAAAEYDRYKQTADRGLELSRDRVYEQFHDKTILVTGGTGLIGSTLMREVAQYGPARLVSFSRGIIAPHRPSPVAEYRFGDIRDTEHVAHIMQAVKPDIVMHVAADKYNHLAEGRARHTLTTNIEGTQNIIEAAEAAGVARFIYASTGKASRPFSPDIYASSKKAGEWLVSEAALRGTMICSAGRFTHVADSSYLLKKLDGFVQAGEPVEIHNPDSWFYVQSALESAHLLLNSTLDAEPGLLKIHAIRNLGMPINLLELGLGAIVRAGLPAAMYIKGVEAGYEEKTWPGLYHHATAGDVSPLISALESDETVESASCEQVDVFPMVSDVSNTLAASFADLRRALKAEGQTGLRALNQDFSWNMLKARLEALPTATLRRTTKHIACFTKNAEPYAEHDQLNAVIIEAHEQRLATAATAIGGVEMILARRLPVVNA
ncbi:MAG: putative nucleoside-diphosphate sugar epimerase [Candidatus Saccharibacteria bacterium]|nr:putative nucleoside-diphosphate sugar epimerase [Candidatus Saccharibacteria bacterium]